MYTMFVLIQKALKKLKFLTNIKKKDGTFEGEILNLSSYSSNRTLSH